MCVWARRQTRLIISSAGTVLDELKEFVGELLDLNRNNLFEYKKYNRPLYSRAISTTLICAEVFFKAHYLHTS